MKRDQATARLVFSSPGEREAARRMREFLADLYGLRSSRATAEAQTSAEINVPVFETFLTDLNEAVGTARRSGAFIDTWSVAGLRRDELRIASVLAWALDPRASHGKGNLIFRSLIDLLSSSAGSSISFDIDLAADYSVSTETCPLGNRENRVDIVVEGKRWVVFIEVKVDAPETRQQLRRYVRAAREKADATKKPIATVLYISNRMTDATPGVLSLDWRAVAHATRCAVSENNGPLDFPGFLLLQFADYVDRLR